MTANQIHYRQYERLLVDLHLMIASGTGDSDQAMELRERMESTAAHLSESEVSRLDALSGDLSMIHNREIPDAQVVARVPSKDLPLLVANAYQQGVWEEMLQLLRADVSSFLKPEQLAYLRSRAYEKLGEWAPAIAFMDEAVGWNSQNVNYQALAMELLWNDNRYDEAYARAKDYLNAPKISDRLVLMAAGILSRLAQRDHPPSDLATVAQNALARIEQAIPGENDPSIRSAAHVSMGLLAEYVSDDSRATTALQKALDEPNNAQFQAIGVVQVKLDSLRKRKRNTPESRALSRTLAEVYAPGKVLQAA